MREQGNINKNLLVAVAVLIAVGVAGYFYSTRDRVSDTDLLIGTIVDDSIASVDGDLLSALRDLRTIRLDESVFSDPVFMSLLNFSTTLAPQPSGRQNPFAPIGVQSTISGTTTPR